MDNSLKKEKGQKFIENRCGNCRHLLFKSAGLSGAVEIKCNRCSNLNMINIQPESRSYQERLSLVQK